jgi:hypothetical protein
VPCQNKKVSEKVFFKGSFRKIGAWLFGGLKKKQSKN